MQHAIDRVLAPIHSHILGNQGAYRRPSFPSAPRSAPGSPKYLHSRDLSVELIFANDESAWQFAINWERLSSTDCTRLIGPYSSQEIHKCFSSSSQILSTLSAPEDNFPNSSAGWWSTRDSSRDHHLRWDGLVHFGEYSVSPRAMEMGVSASQFFILNLFRGTRFETRTSFTPILYPDVFLGFVFDSFYLTAETWKNKDPVFG